MTKKSHAVSIAALGVAASAVVIAVESAARVPPIYVVASAFAIVAGTGYAWFRSNAPQTEGSRFRALVKGSLVFFCGTVYGVAEWSHDGWKVADLAYLVFPAGMTIWLFWAALKTKRNVDS